MPPDGTVYGWVLDEARQHEGRIVSHLHVAIIRDNARWTLRDYLRECQSDWRYPNGLHSGGTV